VTACFEPRTCINCPADITHKRATALRCDTCQVAHKVARRDWSNLTPEQRAAKSARQAGYYESGAMVHPVSTATVPDGDPRQCRRPTCKRIKKAHGLCAKDAARWLRGTYTEDGTDRSVPGWQIPDDGIIDEIAIDIAATGQRRVRLTPTELRLAARRIIASGFKAKTLEARLGISRSYAQDLVTELSTSSKETGVDNALHLYSQACHARLKAIRLTCFAV
jgi:hypothetical protein